MTDGQTPPLAHLEVTWTGSIMLAVLTGEIDRSNAGEIGDAVAKSAAAATAIVVHLGELTYLDSAALTMVHKLALDGSALCLVATPGSRARRLIEIAGLDIVITIVSSTAEAIEKMS